MTSHNPYTVLELSSNATDAEIKAAYKRLAFRHHPDRNKNSQFHTEKFQQIVAAYSLLTDPDQRARFDRRFTHTSRASSGPVHSPGNASAYRGARTHTRPATGETRMGTGGRRYSYVTPHQIFIALTIMACIAMASLWFGSIMARSAAKESVAAGDYIAAIEYDDTYGEAWLYLGKRQAELGQYEQGLANITKGMSLADAILPEWFWLQGNAAEHTGHYRQALHSYSNYLMYQKQDSISFLSLADSCRLHSAYILLFKSNVPDSAYAALAHITANTALRPASLYYRGLAALRTGRLTESIPLLQAAADSFYLPGKAYEALGQAYLATADTGQACRAWSLAANFGLASADSLLHSHCIFNAASASTPITLHVQSRSAH